MLEDPLLIPYLLIALVAGQLLVLILLLRLSGRVTRLSRLIAPPAVSASRGSTDRNGADGDRKKWFAQFLAEDPSRENLPKKEQFAAFRRWREERGMNWKGPAEPG